MSKKVDPLIPCQSRSALASQALRRSPQSPLLQPNSQIIIPTYVAAETRYVCKMPGTNCCGSHQTQYLLQNLLRPSVDLAIARLAKIDKSCAGKTTARLPNFINLNVAIQ